MNKEQEALSILVEAANLAQKRGAFSFDEAVMVKKAIDTFTKKPESAIMDGGAEAPINKTKKKVK